MISPWLRAGRRLSRPALVVLGSAAIVALAFAATRNDEQATPIATPNPAATFPMELSGSVRRVVRREAAELLIPDSTLPDKPARLLWFEGRQTAPVADGVVVLDGVGGGIRFDERLTPHRIQLHLDGREAASIAGAGDGYWVVDGLGKVIRLDREGRIETVVTSPFDYATVAASESGRAWLVRSAERFAFRIPDSLPPLLIGLDDDGTIGRWVGSVDVPEHVLLTELVGAGHIAVRDDVIYYAPFIRDEIVAFSSRGDTLWVASRRLPQSTLEPRFEVGPEGPTIDYAPVNLGIAVGPDRHVYVLSVPGFTTSESRLDVFQSETGDLLRTAHLETPLPTIVVAADGRLHTLDPIRLLTGIAPPERELFARFDLERLNGGRMTTEDLQGRVVLVNFWASWCAPCRHEMPALDSLQRTIADQEFAFVTMNEDVRPSDARAFLAEHGFAFPVLLGKGNLRVKYHYVGLPLTLLLDREGRVVRRWIGFAGEEQIEQIRAVIRLELNRGRPSGTEHPSQGM